MNRAFLIYTLFKEIFRNIIIQPPRLIQLRSTHVSINGQIQVILICKFSNWKIFCVFGRSNLKEDNTIWKIEAFARIKNYFGQSPVITQTRQSVTGWSNFVWYMFPYSRRNRRKTNLTAWSWNRNRFRHRKSHLIIMGINYLTIHLLNFLGLYLKCLRPSKGFRPANWKSIHHCRWRRRRPWHWLLELACCSASAGRRGRPAL